MHGTHSVLQVSNLLLKQFDAAEIKSVLNIAVALVGKILICQYESIFYATLSILQSDPEVTDPTSISTDEEEEEIEDDSLEEEEEEESLLTTSESKGDTNEASTDDEAFLHTNYNFMEKEQDFMEKEKFGKCLEQLQSGFTDDVATGRLSISSKFLSRSQLSQPRSVICSYA